MRDEIEAVIADVAAAARRYLDTVDHRPVLDPTIDYELFSAHGLPEQGIGAAAAIKELVNHAEAAAIGSVGPRFFHYVISGTTPAALGADWLASTYDQNAAHWSSSQLATHLELRSIEWLKQLFDLPREWAGVLTTGGTGANLIGLAAARQWWGLAHGIDIGKEGLSGLPPIPVFSGGYVHPTALKALAILGVGRENVRRLRRDEIGRLDVQALNRELDKLECAPAIVIANAGEVNAGDFDPIEQVADLAEAHGAWLHVDGAFGMFARLSPRTAHLAAAAERAHSATADGHKWLNVPHDCGFVFVRDGSLLQQVFGFELPFLPLRDDAHPSIASSTPEGSRRARAFAVWTTLRAYGKAGYRQMVERHLDLAQHLGNLVTQAPDLELLAEVKLNIVCFRVRPPGLHDHELNDLNTRVGAALLNDGRVYVGTTNYGGHVALRPAIVNWRTSEADIELLVETTRELGTKLARS